MLQDIISISRFIDQTAKRDAVSVETNDNVSGERTSWKEAFAIENAQLLQNELTTKEGKVEETKMGNFYYMHVVSI